MTADLGQGARTADLEQGALGGKSVGEKKGEQQADLEQGALAADLGQEAPVELEKILEEQAALMARERQLLEKVLMKMEKENCDKNEKDIAAVKSYQAKMDEKEGNYIKGAWMKMGLNGKKMKAQTGDG